MKIKKFNIYSADLNPRFGSESGKIRPVVVIQTNLLNDIHPSTIICPVTSNTVENVILLRVRLNEEINNMKMESDILIDQIRSIDNRRFKKWIGELSHRQRKKLLENLGLLILE